MQPAEQVGIGAPFGAPGTIEGDSFIFRIVPNTLSQFRAPGWIR